jgi:hypothetical protein
MLGRPDTQAALQVVFKVADRDACHDVLIESWDVKR